MSEKKNIKSEVLELLSHLLEMKRRFEESSVRIGIIGESGTGKSSVINALLGSYVAEVGATEQTTEPQDFVSEGVTYVDLPGCGTPRWPAKSYVNDLGLLQGYDAFILVTRGRVMENDVALHTELTNAGMPVFVLRNQFDSAIQGARQKPSNRELSDESIISALRTRITDDLRDQLGDQSATIYLTACHGTSTFDLERLALELSESLDEIKRVRYLHTSATLGNDLLDAKTQAASKIVAWYARAAAVNALNPVLIAGVGIDVGLVVTMNQHVISCFGLRKEQLDWAGSKSQKTLLIVQKVLPRISSYVTAEGVLALLKAYAGREAVKTVAKYVPLIGQAIAASLGFGIVVKLGNMVIEDCRKTAQELIDGARSE